ncbi:hypothetical protein CHLNCDRAFT_142362 [Chlorella variabilis]|uniref:Uncharacterized protein n=1 Tax=Chlorella variabilis TaxID=554065 RepID=E1Z8D6_CHLVA|nr:hypothetical protein CHLNCDRAFT_142362 [Chlorella variabilis]EFN58328.1 hypothetical protein CHLNCDRAFT_142362 [Chlorella variabilis]|eukprot:XP_005850430.1 hypothetical protein CHLNCDRAFT_142362 [Chlorella variabilis]
MNEDAGAWEEGGGDSAAAAVPPDVAASMRQFIQALTTPESELEQQIVEEVGRWATRHEPPPATPLPAHADSRCLAGSSMNNSRGSSLAWSAGAGAGAGPSSGRGSSDDDGPAASSSSSSARGSEEGTSAAWRLCAWLRRAGWPAQHCASIRTGSNGGGSGGGWHFCSGHEFLLLHPHKCGGARRGAASRPAPAASSCSSDDGGSGGDSCVPGAGGRGCGAAIVVDPEFSTQFALASPSPRYQALLLLLPRVFQLVEWVCREMQFSFTQGGSGVPPWRSLAHVLDKWRLREEERGEGTAADQLLQPPPPLPHLARPAWEGEERRAAAQAEQQQAQKQAHWCGSAFSAEQQQAMRQLLVQQAMQVGQAPPRRAARASSSASSMDVAAPHVGGGLSPQRSALTLELAGAQVQQEQEAPAWAH